MAEHPEVDDARMPFVEHLRELRLRLRNSAIALGLGLAIAGFFYQEIFALLARPLAESWTRLQATHPEIGDPELRFTSLVEPFWTFFSVALWAGIFISSPFVFHQVWKFVAPGLYKHERRYGVTFAASSAVLFSAGALFCYVLVLPVVIDFLLGYATADLSRLSRSFGEYNVGESLPLLPMPTLEEYLQFTRKLMLGFGLVFELPLLILFLSITGAVTHRSLWKFNRWWIVLSFVLSALLTPPDVLSQSMMAGPLIVLYNLSIVISYAITVRRERRQRALERAHASPGRAAEPTGGGDGGGLGHGGGD